IRESNDVRCIDLNAAEEMRKKILDVKNKGDSVGGVIEVIALNVPPGIGEPIFGKLNSEISYALSSIPAVKCVEIGRGIELSEMLGSESNDEIYIDENKKILTKTNNCGGILGGISNGMPIVARAYFKPTSSIKKIQNTIDIEKMENTKLQIRGRHDPCVVPRAVVIVEAMLSIVIVDAMMMQGIIPRKF
ncbi:MAG: chorismate synthase, partial [Candidatus Altarchaeaceae archaeon]